MRLPRLVDTPPVKLALGLTWRAALGAALTGLVVACWLPRQYASEATLVFMLPTQASPVSEILSAGLGRATVPENSDFPLGTYVTVLTSNPALLNVAREFGIQELYRLQNEDEALVKMKEIVSADVDRVNQTVVVRARIPGTPRVVGARDLFDGGWAKQRDEAHMRLTVEVVNAVIAQMTRIADEMQLDRYKHNLNQLNSRLVRERALLDERVAQLERVQSELGNVDIVTYTGGVTQALLEVRGRLGEIEGELAQYETMLGSARTQLDRQLASVEALPADLPLLFEARRRYTEARAKVRLLEEKFGPENPELLVAQRELQIAERDLHASMDAARGGLTTEILSLESRVSGLRAQRTEANRLIAGLEAEMKALPADVVSLTRLEAEVRQQTAVVERLAAQELEAQLAYDRRGVRYQLLNEPRVPVRKSGPAVVGSVILGALAGMALLGFPLLRDLAARYLFPPPAAE